MVFTRSNDVVKYIETLEDIIYTMLGDFATIYESKSGYRLDKDDILNWYYDAVSEPDPLEMALIEDGSYSDEYVKELHRMYHDRFINYLKHE